MARYIETARLYRLAKEASKLMREMRLRVDESYSFSPEKSFDLPAQYIDPNLMYSTLFTLTQKQGPIGDHQVKSYGELTVVVGLYEPQLAAVILPHRRGILTPEPETGNLVEASLDESAFVVGILRSMLEYKNYNEFANSPLTKIFSS